VPSFPNAPRPIDIDIIFYGDLIMETPDLTIPHPRLEERAFVLIPLLEVAPDLRHPVSGENVKDLAARVGGREGVEKIGELRAEDV
jgi:2-amino-4-hydroxy-6-hydroxymethyldihydropteridine diphosphokinase